MTKKAALLMGLNYRGSSAELNGCINDAENIKKVLLEHYSYEEDNITFMTDDTKTKPTQSNIVKALYAIVDKANSQHLDEIWISYSGHGSYIRDKSGDEDDGKDEVLVPLDYNRNGYVVDDLIHDIISRLNPKTRCIMVVDACHSSTMVDLPYRYVSGVKSVVENKRNDIKGNVIMISGCKDNQTSADYWNKNAQQYAGAMTVSLLTTLKEHNYDISCYKLLKHMRVFLKEHKMSQIPQMSCTRKLSSMTLFSLTDEPFSYMTK